jgi:hypothetical protein
MLHRARTPDHQLTFGTLQEATCIPEPLERNGDARLQENACLREEREPKQSCVCIAD